MQRAGHSRAGESVMNGIGASRALPVQMASGIAARIVIDRGVTVAEAIAASRTRERRAGMDSTDRMAADMPAASGEVGRAAVGAAEVRDMPAASRKMRCPAAAEMRGMSATEMRSATAEMSDVTAAEMRTTPAEMGSAATSEVCATATSKVPTTAAAEVSAAATVAATSTAMASPASAWTRIGDS